VCESTAKQIGLRATLVAQAVCTEVQAKRAQLHTSKAIMGYFATSKRRQFANTQAGSHFKGTMFW
jgi:hypothetical protein